MAEVLVVSRTRFWHTATFSNDLRSDTSNNGDASCRKWCRFLLWTECRDTSRPSPWIKGANSITVASKSDCESPACSSPPFSLSRILFSLLVSIFILILFSFFFFARSKIIFCHDFDHKIETNVIIYTRYAQIVLIRLQLSIRKLRISNSASSLVFYWVTLHGDIIVTRCRISKTGKTFTYSVFVCIRFCL